jgi:hypothetical protein
MGEGNLKSAESATTTRQKKRGEREETETEKERHRKEREICKEWKETWLISTIKKISQKEKKKKKEHATFPQNLFIFMRKK